jgi:hypothetical protein
MPLYRFRVETQNAVTYYVKADNPDDIKEWILGGENPNDLEYGPGHDDESSTSITSMEELTETIISV